MYVCVIYTLVHKYATPVSWKGPHKRLHYYPECGLCALNQVHVCAYVNIASLYVHMYEPVCECVACALKQG